MSELKPCPFCGADDIISDSTPDFEDSEITHVYVQCKECAAMLNSPNDTTEYVESLWNTRHQPGHWTDDVPTEAGHYYWRLDETQTSTDIAEIYNDKVWWSRDGEGTPIYKVQGQWWSERIKIPEAK